MDHKRRWCGDMILPYIQNSIKKYNKIQKFLKSGNRIISINCETFINKNNRYYKSKNNVHHMDYSVLPTNNYIHTQFDLCVKCGCKKFACECGEEYDIRIGMINMGRFISLFF